MQRRERTGKVGILYWLLILGFVLCGCHIDVSIAQSHKTVTYYYTDPQGSVLATTDENGSITSSGDYRSFGESVGSQVQAGPSYTGHVSDAESNFIYAQQRYYDPAVGRFLSVDPIGVSSGLNRGLNRYWYASNNPYTNIDPDGRDSVGEIIDANAIEAASNGSAVAVYGWAFAGAVWNFAGAEGVSQIADKGWSQTSQSDKANAVLEIASALPPVKIVGEAASLAKEAGVVEKASAQGPRYATGKLRQLVMDKGRLADGTVKCAYCGKPTATASDHVVPYSKGGPTKIENLDPSCTSCNSSKGSKELGTEWIPPKDRGD